LSAGRAPAAPDLHALPWASIEEALDAQGYATTGPLLDASECAALVAGYDDAQRFRSRVVMQRHGYGRGEYRYYAYPLPPLVAALRSDLYAALVPVANRWMEKLGSAVRYPATHAQFLQRCHARGQTRPTALVLRYGAGDYNCLHQDLYGEELFPLQATFLLAAPERDFSGGEFLLTSSRPRRQTQASVVPLVHGEGVIFAVRERPEAGVRGWRKVSQRHGVSVLHRGARHALGIIFHDAAG
jgi:uncharacterized protein